MPTDRLAAYLAIASAPVLEPRALAERASALLEAALEAEPGAQASVLEALALDIERGEGSLSTSARMAGALVEHGVFSERLAAALTARLASFIEGASASLEAAFSRRGAGPDDELDDAAAEALAAELAREPSAVEWRLLGELHPALGAVLGASAEWRRRLRPLAPRLSPLEPWHPGASFIRRLLDVLDDEPLEVLHVASGRAFGCRMSGVLRNADLFVLLGGALSGDPAKGWLSHAAPPAEASACLGGEGPQESGLVFECPWNVYTPAALAADHTLPDAFDYSAASLWVWPEGEPSEIPVLEGARVVLLGPPAHARVIAVERAVSTLRASIEARPLSPAETRALVERIDRARARLIAP